MNKRLWKKTRNRVALNTLAGLKQLKLLVHRFVLSVYYGTSLPVLSHSVQYATDMTVHVVTLEYRIFARAVTVSVNSNTWCGITFDVRMWKVNCRRIYHIADGWGRFAFVTRWNSVHLQVLLSATPQGGMFPEVSHPQALLGSLVSIFWKFQFTKIVSEFVINF